MVAGTWEYEFDTIDLSDYNLKIIFKAEGKLFNEIFNLSKMALKKRFKVIDGDLKPLDKFDLDPRYLNYVYGLIKNQIKAVSAEVGKDGITVIDSHLVGGYFEKKKDIWNIVLTINGRFTYDKKKNNLLE